MPKSKRFPGAVLAVLICLKLLACTTPSAPRTVTLLHFNDVYELETVDGIGGAARAQTLVKRYASENPLVVFSGDAFGGSPIAFFGKGKPLVETFNALGLDVAVLGNHEFDLSPEDLTLRVKESRATWIASNLVDKQTGEPPVGAKAYALMERNGVTLGFVGLIDDWINETTGGKNLRYLDFLEQGRRTARLLRAKGADVIVALTHMYLRHDEILAREAPEIDLILGGHDHDFIHREENGRLIWKSGSNLENLGLVRLDVTENSVTARAEALPVTEDLPEDPQIAKLVAGYVRQLEAAQKEILGESESELDTRENVVRLEEAVIGNLVADAIREAVEADVALTNGGGLRSKRIYPPGPVTLRMIQDILPFPNKVLKLEVTGRQILAALENGVGNYEHTGGRFPQVSGMSFVFDPAKPKGSRVVAVHVGGRPLKMDKKYSLATLDFLADGGDGYAVFKDARRLVGTESASDCAPTVAEYVKKKGVVAPRLEGRIKKAE